MKTKEQLSGMELIFLALADKTRLRLINLMREGEVCVAFLVEVLKESQPKVSRHLAFLRNAGIVEARREGKWMHYKITEPPNDFASHILKNTILWLDSKKELQGEFQNLVETRNLSKNKTSTFPKNIENKCAETNMNSDHCRELDIFLL